MSLLAMAYFPSPKTSPDASVYDALAQAQPTGCDAVAVLEDERLAGILTAHDAIRKVLHAGLDPHEAQVGSVMTLNPLTMHPGSPARQAVSVMTEGDFRHLPLVQDDGAVVGMLSLRKMVSAVLAGLREGAANGSLADFVDPKHAGLSIVQPEQPIRVVIDALATSGNDAALVKRKDWIVGIVTIHDLINKLLLGERTVADTLVGDVMHAPVMTLRPQATLLDAVNLMQEWNVRHIPLSASWATADGMLSLSKLLVHLSGSTPPHA